MNFYKNAYRIIAGVVLVIGLLYIPLIPYITKNTSFNSYYLRNIYLLYLFQSVSTYLSTYKFILLEAKQSKYIINITDAVGKTVAAAASILVIIFTRNFILYTAINIAINIIKQVVVSVYISKTHPYLNRKVKISKAKRNELISNTKDIFWAKLSSVILTSTDSIIISSFVSLIAVGLISNYLMIIGYIQDFVTTLLGAAQSSVGNMIATEGKEHCEKTLYRMTFVTHMICSFCAVSLICLLNPFITLWIGESYLLDFSVVLAYVISFFILVFRVPIWQMASQCGRFKEIRNISIFGAISNLIISLVLVQFIGILGVVIGTILSQLGQYILRIMMLYRKFFNVSAVQYLLYIIKSFSMLIIEVIITYYLCIKINEIVVNPYISFVYKGLLCMTIPNIINLISYLKSDEMVYIKGIAFKVKVLSH